MPPERERLTGGQWPIKVWHGSVVTQCERKKVKAKGIYYSPVSRIYTRFDLIHSPASGKFLSLVDFAKTLHLNLNLNRNKNGGGMPQIETEQCTPAQSGISP